VLEDYIGKDIDLTDVTVLHEKDNHRIYWLGIDDENAFRCNVYLIEDEDEFILVDPGSRSYFEQVYERVLQITDPMNVSKLILCHQDPDVAASMVDWLQLNENITIYSSARANVLLPHYGVDSYNFVDVVENPILKFKSGNQLHFIESPFLHFPGAFTTLDKNSNYLFSGDIFAALDTSWKLVVEDFDKHKMNLDLFHIDYMASNIAARGYVKRLEGIQVDALLPQHGSIISRKDVDAALEYLTDLRCGTDLIYGDL